MKIHDPTKEGKDIMYLDANNLYLDANNLYGWAMHRYLPYSDFKLVKNVDNFDVNWNSENGPYGYILEVDLKYPDNYIVYTMIIHLLQKNLKLIMICYQIIAEKLLANTT